MKRLRLTPEAELDLDEAHLWYHRQAPRLAAEFLAAVNASLVSIQHQPEAYALVDPTTRRALLRCGFRTLFSMRSDLPRSWCTASSTVRGTLARGNVEGADNFAVEQTARSHSLARGCSPQRSTIKEIPMATACPTCGLLNPPEGQRCDCGYSFVTGLTDPFEQTSPHKGVRGWLLWLCLGLTVFSPILTVIMLARGWGESAQYLDRFPGLAVVNAIDTMRSSPLWQVSRLRPVRRCSRTSSEARSARSLAS